MWKDNGRTDDGRTDGRTLTHDKSSHGLWPGELKTKERVTWTPLKIGAHLSRYRSPDYICKVRGKCSMKFRFKKNQYNILNFTYGPDIIISNCNLYSEGRLRSKHNEKRDDFNFPIVNFPFICSNIPAASAYSVYISQLIRYSRACGSYMDFLDIELPLTRQLLNQGFLLVKLKTSLRKF